MKKMAFKITIVKNHQYLYIFPIEALYVALRTRPYSESGGREIVRKSI